MRAASVALLPRFKGAPPPDAPLDNLYDVATLLKPKALEEVGAEVLGPPHRVRATAVDRDVFI